MVEYFFLVSRLFHQGCAHNTIRSPGAYLETISNVIEFIVNYSTLKQARFLSWEVNQPMFKPCGRAESPEKRSSRRTRLALSQQHTGDDSCPSKVQQ